MARHHFPVALGQHQEQLAGFITKTPEERYQEPQDTRHDLVQRVAQYLLASYLGGNAGVTEPDPEADGEQSLRSSWGIAFPM